MIDFARWLILHLGALGLMLLCSAGLGHIVLRRFQFDSMIERLVFATGLGFGIAALIIFVLATACLLYPAVFVVCTVAGALATSAYFLNRLMRRRQQQTAPSNVVAEWRRSSNILRALFALLLVAGVGYWLLILLSALYPPFHWDAVSHHLIISREYLAAHRMIFVEGSTRPVLPALTHLLFTWAMALKDDILAQLVEHTFLMLTAAGLYAWGRRLNSSAFGLTMAAFWLAHPLVLYLGESAYIDIGLTGFVFLGVYALRIFWDRREVNWWFLGMALFGMTAGIKLPGLFFVLAGFVIGLIVLLQSGAASDASRKSETAGRAAKSRISMKTLALGCALALVILLPWYVFVFYHTGDPLWPTFMELRRGAHGDPAAIEDARTWLAGTTENKSLAGFFLLPLNWINHPEWFDSETNPAFFPLFILWPLAWLVAVCNRSVRWWTLWALAFTCFWFLFPHHLRYWLPALPLASVALFESFRWILEKFTKSLIIQTFAWTAIALSCVWGGAGALSKELRGKGFPPPTNDEARDKLLTSMRGYKAVQFINERAGSDEKVIVIRGSLINYYLKPRVIDLASILYRDHLPTFSSPADAEWLRWVESEGVTWIYMTHQKPPPYLKIPNSNPESFWPDFEVVYSDDVNWVFRRKK